MQKGNVTAILSLNMEELISRYRVASLSMFGSTARGDSSSDSDVDLLVDFVGKPDYDMFMDLKIHLEELLGCRVDLITHAGLKGRIRESVEREAVRVA